MATLEAFESLLKEVVTAKRLSASKMNKLTDIAMTLMDYDTELVSTLYRTHKTLAPSSKINSLYAFDALSRAARSKASKSGLIGDINAEKGNFATFLLKIDGVLDGLMQDMISIPSPGAKEKTRKILDIWTKNATFPSNVLARLAEITKDSQKDTTSSNIPSTDPRPPHVPSPITPTQSAPQPPITSDPAQAQALLQALLGSALSSTGDTNMTNGGSTSTQTDTNNSATGLDLNQVALLQQLVERAKAGDNNGVALPQLAPSFPPPPPPSIPTPQPLSSLAPSAPYNSPPTQGHYASTSHDEHSGGARMDQRHSRWDDHGHETPFRGGDHDNWHDRERQGWRGSNRGGRGWQSSRGGRPGWRDNNWEGPSRRRRSRSRSPPRFGGGRGRGGRDIRPYSPPRRPSLPPLIARDETEKPSRSTPPGALQAGKDEFGRDIRSPAAEADPLSTSQLSPTSPDPDSQTTSNPRHSARSPPQATMSSSGASAQQSSSHNISLDKIDFATFDFASPVAWETLGKAWQVTHGSLPSQEDLIELVMRRMSQNEAGNADPEGGEKGGDNGNGWKSSWESQQPGKSIPTYESGSNLSSNSWQAKRAAWQRSDNAFDYEHGAPPAGTDTDAVVLGGGEMQSSGSPGGTHDPTDSSAGGGMKRVGDGWVWQPS